MSSLLSPIEPVHHPVIAPETLAEIGKLRILAWEAASERPSLAPPAGDSWIDSHDAHAEHWTGSEDRRLVAAARMCLHSDAEASPTANFWPVSRSPSPFPWHP